MVARLRTPDADRQPRRYDPVATYATDLIMFLRVHDLQRCHYVSPVTPRLRR